MRILTFVILVLIGITLFWPNVIHNFGYDVGEIYAGLQFKKG